MSGLAGTSPKSQPLLKTSGSCCWKAASCLNAWVDPSAHSSPAGPDGFDNSVTWEQILVPLRLEEGKRFRGGTVWHTPERTKPGYCAVSGIGFNRDLLYMVRTGKAYTKFGAFASFHLAGTSKKPGRLSCDQPHLLAGRPRQARAI